MKKIGFYLVLLILLTTTNIVLATNSENEEKKPQEIETNKGWWEIKDVILDEAITFITQNNENEKLETNNEGIELIQTEELKTNDNPVEITSGNIEPIFENNSGPVEITSENNEIILEDNSGPARSISGNNEPILENNTIESNELMFETLPLEIENINLGNIFFQIGTYVYKNFQ